MKKFVVMLVLAALAGSASAALSTSTTFTNSVGTLMDVVWNHADGTITTTNSNSWSSGLPIYSNPGLVTNGTAALASQSAWYGVAVRQEGGTLSQADLALRGGLPGNTNAYSILEIDDASNTNFAYANLDISGAFTMWNKWWPASGPANTLSVLNGYADVGSLAGTLTTRNFVHILNGKLDAGYLSNARCTVNMLSGGTGQFILDDMYGTDADPDHKSKLKNMILNFETGSEASFTLLASNVTGNAQGAWETKIAAGQVKIDGVAVTGLGAFTIEDVGALGTKISLNPYWATSTIFTGSSSVLEITYSNPPNRGVIISGNTNDWSGGLPTNGNPGLVVGGTYDFVNPNHGGMYGIWVRQTGGQLTDAFLPMRGGAAGTTDGNIITIDDASNDGSYTNLAIEGELTMWNSNVGTGGTGNELSVLNGYATVGDLNTTPNPAVNARFNILNGRLDVGSLLAGKASCTVTMQAGGTGEVNLADMTSTATMNQMVLNFETGSKASFTIGSNGAASAQGTWESYVTSGFATIDGVTETDLGQFTIEDVGATGTKISLNPYRINLTFIGQNNDPDAPVGAVSVAANWSGGALPSGDWTGEICATSNVWPGAAWSNINVRQTGGSIEGTDLELSAGSRYTIDDPRTHYATYTNLYLSDELDVGAELNLLSGHIEAGTLNLSASGTINIHQGIFNIASISNASGTVTFMASGGGALTTDSFDADPGSFALNFERGTRGSINGLDSATWTSMITNGQVSIDGVVSTDLALFSVASTLSLVPAAPWWDDFPRIVTATDVATVTNVNGTSVFGGSGGDPSWGTFFQADSLSVNASKRAAYQNAGLKQLSYFETYGQSYCLVAELAPEPWDDTKPTDVLTTHWGWQNYGTNGPIRWLGSKNFFDDEDFARPYTRTHPRYGGPAMTYPDGTVATGYDGPDTDPRNSRVYDAAVSKDVLGNVYIDMKYAPPNQPAPTNGLVYLPELDEHIGLFMFKKDATCPLWDDYTYASTLQAADAGIDGTWTDNYGPWDSLSSSPVKAAFGDWSVARFRDHLTNSFSSAELLAMGVTNAAAFDVREHMKDVATGLDSGWGGTNLAHSVWSNSEWMDDALWRAYLIFKRQTGTEALSNYYSTVKTAALAGGKEEFLVAGNDIPGFSHGWCRGDLDMVSTEMTMGWKLSGGSDGFMAPPVGRYSPFYKVARAHAKSRFVNVWLYNDHYEEEFTNPELCKVMYYEMLATHTFPKFDPDNARIAGDDETNGDFFEFVGQAASVYGDRVPAEDIGLYYSSSSIVRQMTPRGYAAFNAQPHQFSFWGWGTALTELHMQYRAVPEWKLTAETLAGLKLLILPNADVFATNDVTEVLTPWLNSGGRLVIAGDCGIYHGESGNFASNTTGLAVASITNHANVTVVPDNIGMDYYLAYTNRNLASLSGFSDAIEEALTNAAPSGITDTTAADTTGLTLYEDEAAGRLFIDVNNVNIQTNYDMTGTGLIEIETVLPDWLTNQLLHVSVVTPQTNKPSIKLLSVSNDTIRVELGSVDYYAGVVVKRDTGYAAWQLDYFTPEEIAAGLADPDQDPDGDLLVNLAEYAFGGDPTDSNDQGNTPVLSQFSVATNVIEYVYFERDDAAARGLNSILEVGTDFVTPIWADGSGYEVGRGASHLPGYTAVTNWIPTTDVDDRLFFRLRIEFTP